MADLVFLKLGGSLITDKTQAHTVRPETLKRVAEEIVAAIGKNSDLKLVIGHGSGSFGHVPARLHGTRLGVYTHVGWEGFVDVWREAAALNWLVMDALKSAGLNAVAFPPSASVTAKDGQVESWDLMPIELALGSDVLPVVHGDVVFDKQRGGTILSTEDLFGFLAHHLHPARILLAGIEPGVWSDYPACTRLVSLITPKNIAKYMAGIAGSGATDVTGGMASKVERSLALVQAEPDTKIYIFSGDVPGLVYKALLGKPVGTLIRAS
jgi:isopentenyl phosphate kinase